MKSGCSHPSKLWAVTSYFNPARYRSRLRNYQAFRRHLDLPLLTLYHDPTGNHELSESDAEILIRVGDGDVMWQKERLFNLALEHLPGECEKIVWLDCDVLFVKDGWAKRVETALDEVPVVQPFQVARHISPEETHRAWSTGNFPQIESEASTEFSVVDLWRNKTPISPSRHLVPRPPGPHAICGLGWATRRELSEQLPFFDAFVIGSGDAAFFSGITGDRHIYTRPWGPPALVEAFEKWAARAWNIVGSRVRSVEATICSLWHGSFTDRNYVNRWSVLTEHCFDPDRDLMLSPGGAWSWKTEKPAFHQAIKNYFYSRSEDN